MWPKRVGDVLERFVRRAVRVINGAGSGILAAMMLLVIADVSLRQLFNRPIKGAYDGVELMMVIVVFFAMGYTAMLKGHVVVQILSSRFPQRIRAINDSISYFFCTAFCCLIAWQGAIQAQIIQSRHQVSGVLAYMPLFPFYYVVVFGSALMGLVFLVNLLDSLRGSLKK